MRKLIVRSVIVGACWGLLSGPRCETDLERSDVGSACTRARDCKPSLDCIAGECRIVNDAARTDASSSDAN